MTNYTVTAPLVVVPNSDGTTGDGYFYVGALVPEGWNDERCQQLAREGMLAKTKAPEPEPSGAPTPGSAEDVLAKVGDDKALAKVALNEENAKPTPRKTLVAKLEKIIEG